MINDKREKQIELRNLLKTVNGQNLIEFLGDYITRESVKGINAENLKGMCLLLNYIKEIREL